MVPGIGCDGWSLSKHTGSQGLEAQPRDEGAVSWKEIGSERIWSCFISIGMLTLGLKLLVVYIYNASDS